MSDIGTADGVATPVSPPRPDFPTASPRLDFIDALRGLIICLMVLDHTRDFVNRDAFLFDPLNLDKTSVALFFTRWVTHLCAPTFVFLSGVSIFLQASKGKTGWPLSRFLLTRGLWLLVLEVTLVNFGFDFFWPAIFLQVIYAIGFGMVLMAGLVRLPRLAVLAVGLVLVCGHNLFDAVSTDSLGIFGLPWHLLMQPGQIPGAYVLYPLLPWLGIMCLGFGAGPLFLLPAAQRTRTLLMLSAGMIVLFLILRLPNLYGNGGPWHMPANPALAPLAVLDVTKYPPSLDYVLVTLGVSASLAVALQWAPRLLMIPLLAFGRTPLMTYLLHLFVAHGLAVLIAAGMGIPPADFIGTFSDPSRLIRDGWGLPLWATYLVWLTVLVTLYPISSAFARYRQTHKAWWLSYL